jgi:hypothetical protein
MKQFAVIALLMLLFACSKYARNEKRLPGSWKVDVVRIEDGEGFIFFDSLATGSFSLDAAKIHGEASYTYSYFGQYDVSDSVVFNQSSCALSTNGEVLLIARDTDTLQAKIIVLTKKHLTFEYYDYLQYRLKRFSCTRIL